MEPKLRFSAVQCRDRSHRWLEANARRYVAETETGVKFKDNYLEFLILELTQNWYVLVL